MSSNSTVAWAPARASISSANRSRSGCPNFFRRPPARRRNRQACRKLPWSRARLPNHHAPCDRKQSSLIGSTNRVPPGLDVMTHPDQAEGRWPLCFLDPLWADVFIGSTLRAKFDRASAFPLQPSERLLCLCRFSASVRRLILSPARYSLNGCRAAPFLSPSGWLWPVGRAASSGCPR